MSGSKYDAVLSYHLNPLTCGVAKFNHQLAKRLGVPCLPLDAPQRWALVSIKTSEIRGDWRYEIPADRQFDLLLHDRPTEQIALWPGRVFYADELGCPSTVQGNPHRGSYRVLTFGMAHKLVLPHFEKLKAQLDQEHPDYTISLSTAVHEGSPWDQAFEDSTTAMRAIFGDKLRVLGFLADDALVKELQECDAVAAYFTPALRANNTSAWAALEAGKPLYTNTDAHSPALDVTQHRWESLIEVLSAA